MTLQDPLFPLLWLVGWIGGSILYRVSRGKPIFFFGVPDAVYQERAASGHSRRFWISRFGGARNCLVVAITADRFVVRPWFPFNLMFLPEIYGLEIDVPLDRLISAKPAQGLFARGTDVRFRIESGDPREFRLYLRRPKEFLSAVKRYVDRPTPIEAW